MNSRKEIKKKLNEVKNLIEIDLEIRSHLESQQQVENRRSLALFFDNVDDVTTTEKFHEIFLGKVLESSQDRIWGSDGGFGA